jgi:gluconolactonase
MAWNWQRLGAVAALAAGVWSAAPARAQQQKAYPALGSIERLDPKLDQLVPRDARIEKLAEGFDWSEGPVWSKPDRYLLFSDVPRNTVFQWREGQQVHVYLNPSGYTGKTPGAADQGSNGLLRDADGRLVLCQHGDRRVARLEPDGSFKTLADRYDGKRFNSPNDGVYRSNGDLYFTDPPYGLRGLNNDPAKEIPFNGVYRVARDGTVTLLTREMTFPNGIAFAPGEKTLYVANSDFAHPHWMAFEVKDDGTLGKGRVFHDATAWLKAGKKGLPDGMKVDQAGNLFATGPGGIHVFSPEGNHLGTLNTGEATANCAWGDDGATLYITADMYLCRIRLATRGQGF